MVEQWLAVFAPAGTPADIVARLNAEIGKALAALEPIGGTPGDLARLLRGDYDKYARLIRELNIKLE